MASRRKTKSHISIYSNMHIPIPELRGLEKLLLSGSSYSCDSFHIPLFYDTTPRGKRSNSLRLRRLAGCAHRHSFYMKSQNSF